MMTRRHLVLPVLALLVGGCSGGPPADPSGTGVEPPTTVTVERGSIVSTVVIPATVEAGGTVAVTAPAAGTYTAAGSGITYRLDSGRRGRLALPSGLEILPRTVVAGRHVPLNFPIAEARIDGFALVAQLDAATTYRLYSPPVDARGQITEGPGPFSCPLADRVPRPAGPPDPGQPAPLTLTCLIPPGITAFAGMSAVMAVTTAVATNVLVLPIEAVAGSAQQGQVWLVDAAGRRRLQDVRLGITDGTQIEIVSGVGEGDPVLIPGPDLASGSR